jgi:alpha-L-fucosidase
MNSKNLIIILCLLFASHLRAQETNKPELMLPDEKENPRIQKWMNYHYGMFIHYSMNTFVGTQHVPNPPQATTFAPPPTLNVDEWVKLAKDAGMKYAVLTTRHSAGFCLWDSKVPWHGKEFEYDVAASGNKTDLVQAFMDACKKYGISPGFYYCLIEGYANTSIPFKEQWSKGLMPDDVFDLAKAQLSELATKYPDCHYFWIDIPGTASVAQQAELYDMLRRKNPENVILMNAHHAAHAKQGDEGLLEKKMSRHYPSDFLNTEAKQRPEATLSNVQRWNGKTLFLGYEHCDTAGHGWFNSGQPKPADELFELYQSTRNKGGNLLLDIGPPSDGVIPPSYREMLLQLKNKIESYEKTTSSPTK